MASRSYGLHTTEGDDGTMTHYHPRDRLWRQGTSVLCTKCQCSGYTLVKISNHYEHENKTICEFKRRRREEDERAAKKLAIL